MGKRRNTAKTGDKASYKTVKGKQRGGRAIVTSNKTTNDDDDPMYNEIDRFHKERDEEFIRLEGANRDDDDDDDGIVRHDAIMDLGIGGEDDSSSSSSSDNDDDSDNRLDANDQVDSDENSNDDDDDEEEGDSFHSDDDGNDDEDAFKLSDPRNWGKKKSLYYHGDTADLEIGQNEEDAYLEEEAALEVQAARLKNMTEDDFVLSDNDDDTEKQPKAKQTKKRQSSETKTKDSLVTTVRDVSKLSNKEKRMLLNKQHPELLPIVSHFKEVVQELKEQTLVATKALIPDGDEDDATAKAVGATHAGRQYLLTKSLLQSSMALNVTMYLLLGSGQQKTHNDESDQELDENDLLSGIRSHPVMARLQQLNSFAQKLEDQVEDKVENLQDQLANLVKASALMQSDLDEIQGSDVENQHDGDENANVDKDTDMEDSDQNNDDNDSQSDESIKNATTSASSNGPAQNVVRNVLNEAKFGLRSNEIGSFKKTKKNAKQGKKQSSINMLDFGDNDDDDGGEQVGGASKSLASTINALEQRSATKLRKRRPAPIAEQLDDLEGDDDELRRGIQMMEEELGKVGSDDDDDGRKDSSKRKDREEEIDDELGNDPDLEFYNIVSKDAKSKKAFKKSLHQVAPKYPRIDNEVVGERAISKTILKNRGLVAHKAKINRNPRVKKREQYRKALIRRKGAVREIRTNEGHKYAGEETGIKSGLSRSRKLAPK